MEKNLEMPAIDNKQLDIFFFIEEKNKFSNTIELFDSIPFYLIQQPKKDKDVGYIQRKFKYKDKSGFHTTYSIKIFPGAHIKEFKKGKNKGNVSTKQRYPSVTDELIEQIIRKMAASGQAYFKDNQVYVAFSIYQIYEELKEKGLTRSYNEIVESIDILTTAFIEMEWVDENNVPQKRRKPIFDDYRKASPESITYKGKKDLIGLRFHPLVTESIISMSFKQFDYDKHMQISDFCARWIHKKICHYYTQASTNPTKYYNLSLESIVEGSGIKYYNSIYDTIKRVSKALKKLVKQDVLQDFKVIHKKNTINKNKVTDAVFHLFPSTRFVDEQIAANARNKKNYPQKQFSNLRKMVS